MIAVEYLRVLVAGVAARAWRLLRGRPCSCEWCRAHNQFVAETTAAYVDEVRARGVPLERVALDDVHAMWTADRAALVRTLGEAREGRHE